MQTLAEPVSTQTLVTLACLAGHKRGIQDANARYYDGSSWTARERLSAMPVWGTVSPDTQEAMLNAYTDGYRDGLEDAEGLARMSR